MRGPKMNNYKRAAHFFVKDLDWLPSGTCVSVSTREWVSSVTIISECGNVQKRSYKSAFILGKIAAVSIGFGKTQVSLYLKYLSTRN